jgi:hypothetical protein
VLRCQMRDKAGLMRIINELHRENRASLRQIPEPVGRTVRLVQIGSNRNATVIDEPAAEVLRSPDQLTLGEPVTYDVKIHGVFKTNGACRIEIWIRGKSSRARLPTLRSKHLTTFTRRLSMKGPSSVLLPNRQ